MRILIAEDDQVLADALLRSLRTSGAAVDRVATGTQAEREFRASVGNDVATVVTIGLEAYTAG